MEQQLPPFPMLARLRCWGIHVCAGCVAKVLTTELPADAILPPGWDIRYGFTAPYDRLLCGTCLMKPRSQEEVAEQAQQPQVGTSVSEVEIKGDRRLIQGVRVKCGRCGHTTESFGTSSRSVGRCLFLLNKECPREEDNFYTEDDGVSEKFVGPDTEEDDEGEDEEPSVEDDEEEGDDEDSDDEGDE